MSFFYRLRSFRLIFFVLLAGVSIVCPEETFAAPPTGGDSEAPVNFTAKSLSHDNESQIVTAIGDVELVQDRRVLHADRMTYYMKEDRVVADGNVSLLDERGDVHFVDHVELQDKMKAGFMRGLLTLLTDGSRFTAATAERKDNGTKTVMTKATYTMCKVCETNPHPIWQVKADEVTHDAVKKTVSYKNARVELGGIPIFYTPVLSHPDPTLKRRSGLLRPEYGWTTALGTHVKGGYYYAAAPDKDATVWLEPTELEGTLVGGEWRQRFANGQMKIDASTAKSDRKEEDGRLDTNRQRGDIFANAKFDFTDRWRGGFDFGRVTDKQYLRLYDISKENVITNSVYAERFSGRDYSRVSALNFQDLRLGVRPDQPDIFPMIRHSMIGEPNALMGGRWQMDFSGIGLNRQNGNQSVQRESLSAGWEKQRILPQGVLMVMRLNGRGDIYTVQNSNAFKANPLNEKNPNIFRGLAGADMMSSYPVVRRMGESQMALEPVAGVSFSPRTGQNRNIPNEDSVDIQFNSNTLFQNNGFSGADLQEGGGRMNYGLKAGLHVPDGKSIKVFVGQSYHFYGDKVFPAGSGMEERLSNYVGQVRADLSKYLNADYRFQLDNRSMAIRQHEAEIGGGNDKFHFDTGYLFLKPVAGTGFVETRQQVQARGTYNFTQSWALQSSVLTDLGDQPGLRNAMAGLSYSDECFVFSTQWVRSVATAASGGDETRLMLRIGLKSIGELSGTQIPLGGSQTKK